MRLPTDGRLQGGPAVFRENTLREEGPGGLSHSGEDEGVSAEDWTLAEA